MDIRDRAPRARYAALAGFTATCREVGVDPYATMQAHRLDPAKLDDVDAWAPALDVVRTLESAATTAGCGSVGVRMARRRTLAAVGPLSLVLSEEPTFRQALELLGRFWPSYNEALRLRLIDEGTFTTVAVSFDLTSREPHTQAIELSLGVIHALARSRNAPINPLDVTLRHDEPADGVEQQRALFNTHLRYGADVDGLTFATKSLDLVTTSADPLRREYVQRFLSDFTADEQDAGERVRRLIADLLPTGRCSVTRVAQACGVTVRTLHRHLEREGTGYAQLLHEVREEACARMLANHERPLGEVGEALGFTTPSSFSRWFVATHGMTATQWRATQR